MKLRDLVIPRTAAAIGARDAARNFPSEHDFVEIPIWPISTPPAPTPSPVSRSSDVDQHSIADAASLGADK